MAKTILQNQRINKIVRQTVLEVIREIFSDPDYGLFLTSQASRRLKKSIQSKKVGRLTDFKDILKKYYK